MPCILLVDESDIAHRAMKGILLRGHHRVACVSTVMEAWDFIREHVRVDMVITELKLGKESGMSLVEKLKADAFLKLLPIVFYAEHGDREAVRQALGLKVQNFLLKPYVEDAVHTEISKAVANPWRARHFEEERSFCKLMGLEPARLHAMLDELGRTLVNVRPQLERCAASRGQRAAGERIEEVKNAAEAAGAWGVVELLGELEQKAEMDDWNGFLERLDSLAYAQRLIAQHLDNRHMPAPFLTLAEQNAEHEEHERLIWTNAWKEQRCPVVDFPRLQREADALSGCPMMESTAAAFEMSATGHPSSLNPLMDLVERDPGLAAELLIAGGQVKRREDLDPAPLEDPRLAVGRLGEVKLAALARKLVVIEERHCNLPPHFSWTQFWTFQMGVARMARFAAHYLEFYSMEPQAFMAGLLHDLGKLVLMRLYPFGFQATLAHAREQPTTLAEAERRHFGCTSHEIGAHFAERNGLSPAFVSVIRWVDNPEAATEHRNLVAVVALARDLCRHNHLGQSGDTPLDQPLPIEQTPEWSVLTPSLFPSFNLRKFELQVHTDCRELKLELGGRLRKP